MRSVPKARSSRSSSNKTAQILKGPLLSGTHRDDDATGQMVVDADGTAQKVLAAPRAGR